MNKAELMAQFEVEFTEHLNSRGEIIPRFTFRKSDIRDRSYHYNETDYCYQMWKRAMQQSEQRIAELEAQTQWQPIETAPKDGSHVLVLSSDGVSISRSVLSELHGHHWDGVIGVKHWMPLPKAPEVKS